MGFDAIVNEVTKLRRALAKEKEKNLKLRENIKSLSEKIKALEKECDVLKR